jgi:hypothetical protein
MDTLTDKARALLRPDGTVHEDKLAFRLEDGTVTVEDVVTMFDLDMVEINPRPKPIPNEWNADTWFGIDEYTSEQMWGVVHIPHDVRERIFRHRDAAVERRDRRLGASETSPRS